MEDGVVDIVRRGIVIFENTPGFTNPIHFPGFIGGVPIHKTAVYKSAKTDADKKKVMDHAQRLIEQENARHAKTDGLINACVGFIFHRLPYLTFNFSDTHHSNVVFHETSGGLHKAQFIDWSHTKKA